MNQASKIGHRPDYFLAAVIFILIVFGLAMLASASSDLGKTKFNDSYYYIRHQVYYGLSLGIIGFFVGYFFRYQRWHKLAMPLLLLGIIALALVFTRLGVGARGANRWLQLGPVSFQPAELMKLAFIVYISAWLSNPKTKRPIDFQEGLLPFLLISGFIATLLILQPATSTVVILLGSGLVIYFLSGARWKYMVMIIFLAILALAMIIYATPYRRARISGFLSSNSDAQGKNYQVNQALIAIGSGGLTGVGYGQSATKIGYLPAPVDDSIFAVIAEELGFIGSSLVVILFASLILRLFWLAKEMRESFGKFILVGFGSVIAIQAFINIAAISGITPLTGIPLPFISYGGTALAVFMTMSGISLNVSKYV